MKLFLCSHFSSVGSLIKEEIDNKKVAFIPTASLREGYTGYVGSARKLFNKLGAAVTEIDISTEAYLTIQSVFEDADVIYFTGGNSFFLMDQLRKTGTLSASRTRWIKCRSVCAAFRSSLKTSITSRQRQRLRSVSHSRRSRSWPRKLRG